jgi:PAS domain S-box-containing protein
MDADPFFLRSPWAQWCVDGEGRLLRYNDAFERMLPPLPHPGSSRPSIFRYVPADEQSRLRALLASLSTTRETDTISLTFTTGNGGGRRTRWAFRQEGGIAYAVELPAESVPPPAAGPDGLPSAPGVSPESLTSLVHQSHDMMARFDRQLRYRFVNDRLLTQTGTLTAAHFLGKTTVEMAPLLGVTPDTFDNWMRDLQKVLTTGAEVHHYDSLELPDRTLHFQTKMFPEYQDGSVSGVLVITRVNNELKVARRRLGERRNLLKMVFDCMQEGVLVVNKQGRFVLSNRRGTTLTPVAPLPTSYREWSRQVHAYAADGKTPLPDADQPLAVALRGGMIQNQVVLFRERTGQWEVHLNVNASALKRPDGEIIGAVIVFSNVSEQLKARERLDASYATLTGIIGSTTDAVVAIDTHYTILEVNAAARAAFKDAHGQPVQPGVNLLAFFADVPALAERFQSYWRRALAGESYSETHTVVTNQGEEKYYESRYSPILNAEKQVLGASLIGRDITDKFRQEKHIKELLERQQLLNAKLEGQNAELLLQGNALLSQQEELRRTVAQLEERNFELDQLIYKTSHDIRSPLTSVLGLVNVIGLEADKSRWPAYLEMIENRIKTLDRFLQSMIFYAKASRSSLVTEPVDFTQLLERTKATLSFLKKFDQLQISLVRTGEGAVFAGDPFRLEILFNNIVSNAIKYQNPAADTHYLRVAVDVTAREARLTFSDNGIGIKPEYADRVFEMFYRATENTDGSGLGLYIVKQIVDKMKGTIRLESRYGRGTTIKVTLPNESAATEAN